MAATASRIAAARNQLWIERDVDAAADQIEIQRLDAGLRERVPDQRRFIGAVHARDV